MTAEADRAHVAGVARRREEGSITDDTFDGFETRDPEVGAEALVQALPGQIANPQPSRQRPAGLPAWARILAPVLMRSHRTRRPRLATDSRGFRAAGYFSAASSALASFRSGRSEVAGPSVHRSSWGAEACRSSGWGKVRRRVHHLVKGRSGRNQRKTTPTVTGQSPGTVCGVKKIRQV